MLTDAILSIHSANEEAERRRLEKRSRRRPIQLLDFWLSRVEGLIEQDESVVPESLMGDIAAYIEKVDPYLNRRLLSRRDATWVLDVLFVAEEEFLPRAAGSADASGD